MPATLTTAPPSRVFSQNDTWVAITTDESITARGSVKLEFSSSGPTAGQTLRLQFAGFDITFTVTSSDGESGSDLPVKGAETLSEYAALVAERFAQNETANAYFRLELLGASLTLVQRLHEPVDIIATSNLSNTTVTVTDVATITTPDALRALVQVWTDTGVIATDRFLLGVHAPYNSDGLARLNIGPAFAVLEPHLPLESSIPAVALPTTQPYGEASNAYTQYYLRYADKGGIPAIAQGLVKSATYTAIHGGSSADSAHIISNPLRHAYTRRDGVAFQKPITDTQPDYLYWVAPSGITQVHMVVTITWSDGTQSVWNPYPTTGVPVEAGRMYWFACGYRQAKIQSAPIQPGTAADAYPVGYFAGIRRTDGVPLLGNHGVQYYINYQGDWQGLHLLFSNGVGGCETVCLRGKVTTKSSITAEEFARARDYEWTSQIGDFGQNAQRARTVWECNTGWVSAPYYIEHLRQLSLGDVWMIDLIARKFRRVIVAPGDIATNTDDETLFSQSFTIRAAWYDQAANV